MKLSFIGSYMLISELFIFKCLSYFYRLIYITFPIFSVLEFVLYKKLIISTLN